MLRLVWEFSVVVSEVDDCRNDIITMHCERGFGKEEVREGKMIDSKHSLIW